MVVFGALQSNTSNLNLSEFQYRLKRNIHTHTHVTAADGIGTEAAGTDASGAAVEFELGAVVGGVVVAGYQYKMKAVIHHIDKQDSNWGIFAVKKIIPEQRRHQLSLKFYSVKIKIAN